jgi:hypothetical protein
MSDQTKLALQHIQVLRGEPLLSKKRLFERSAELLSEELGLHSQAYLPGATRSGKTRQHSHW